MIEPSFFNVFIKIKHHFVNENGLNVKDKRRFGEKKNLKLFLTRL